MHSFTLIFFALVATLALAAPSSKALSKRTSFTVPRVRSETYVRNPRREMAKAYRKFNWSLPEAFDDAFPGLSALLGALDGSSSSSGSSSSTSTGTSKTEASTYPAVSAAASSGASSGESGSTTATPKEQGSEYISPVKIGGQSFNLDFDTGSADLWVFSSSLPSDEIGDHATFDPSKSSSFKQLEGYTFKLEYGDGSGAEGTVGTDTVAVGSASVTGQAVELATAVSSAFVSDSASDGLLGLAFSSLNSVEPLPQKTFFQSIQDLLALPVFTTDIDTTGAGTYEFGAINAAKYTGEITYTAINTLTGFWEVTSGEYSVGGKTGTTTGATAAIIDTGTSLVLVNDDIVQAYYSGVSGAAYSLTQGGYVYPCDATLPTFGIAIGSYMAEIPASGIEYAELGDGTCFGGIQSNSGEEMMILGDVLIRQHFVVFDIGNLKVGFASKSS